MNTQEKQFNGFNMSGFLMLLIQLLLIVVAVWNVLTQSEEMAIMLCAIDFVVLIFLSIGYFIIEPNEVRVMLFFGKYKGTMKSNGFFWANPFYLKKKLIIRARNLDVTPIKVNDKSRSEEHTSELQSP